MSKLSTSERAAIVAALVEGNSIRAICRMQGVGKNTVARLISSLGDACYENDERMLYDLPCSVIQCDEIWSFIHCKDANRPYDLRDEPLIGSVWTWTAIDANTKLMVAWACGLRSLDTGQPFLETVARRVAGTPQVNTDGLSAYRDGVPAAFGNGVPHARIEKRYAKNGRGPYRPERVIGVRKVRQHGKPDMALASTSYVERANLTIRMSVRRFTRLTNAHSKKYEQHVAMLAIFFAYYNLCRRHESLGGMTPAQAAGIADHRWTVEELCELIVKPSKACA